jgi:hypothetical protein
MSRVTKISLPVGLIVALVSIVIVIGRSSRPSPQQPKDKLIERVRQAPDIAINYNNFEGVPLTIQTATSKEVSGSDYQQLTGGDPSGANRFATFPTVKLQNVTNQRIAKLMVAVGDRQTKKWYVVNFHSANIAPQQVFSIAPTDWYHEKKSKDSNDKKATSPSKIRDFDAVGLWWPGGASAQDLVLRIALVEFDNGGKWQADETKGSLW